MSTGIVLAFTLGILGAPPDGALKVFQDIPAGEQRWRLEVKTKGEKVPVVTICTDAFSDMKKKMTGWDDPKTGSEKGCRPDVVRNDARRAEIEATCSGQPATRIQIEKLAGESWSMRIDQGKGEDATTMSVRYERLGPCEKDGPGFSLDGASPQCAQLKAQLQMMTPAMCASLSGEPKDKCLAQIEEARTQLQAICR